jgi:SOS-response transcriptional repressor LexA
MNKPSVRLKKLRLDLKLTQKELGDKLGVPWYLIKNIETEKTKLSIELSESLYKHLNVNINWILSGEGNRFIEEQGHPVPEIREEPELVPEVKEIVYELKDATDKIIDLNKKFMAREDKGIYRVASDRENNRIYPLICVSPFKEDCREDYIELPQEWNIKADFVISTAGMTETGLMTDMLCFIRKQKETGTGNIVALKIYENDSHHLILKKVKYVNGLMEFRNNKGERIENFEVTGIAVFWMSDYRMVDII